MHSEERKSKEIDNKIALEKLISSDWWKIYVSILEEYATRYSSVLVRVDPKLSELKYNTKDINIIFMQNIDLLTSVPGNYIASIEQDMHGEIPLENRVKNDYDRIMQEAVKYVNQSL